MIIGLRYWIWIWYGILALGVVGLVTALYWGGRTGWRNLDEILRATGTIAVSMGMVLLLKGLGGGAGEVLLVVALFSFVMAFVLGRKIDDRRPPDEGDDEA
ncbi:MAG: hypothetical protein R2909_16060 [Gemmatimonadales bacterium]